MALSQDADEEEIDLTKLRYVLYAWRSTEDKNKQVRSLGDQINVTFIENSAGADERT
ncbi:MAG: hypothetical protein ACYCPS_01245 [Candidatus Saccharimonadales bacterium]